MVVTLTIPDTVAPELLDAIAAQNGYNQATDGTKGAFAKSWIVGLCRNQLAGYRVNNAAPAIRTQVNVDLVIT